MTVLIDDELRKDFTFDARCAAHQVARSRTVGLLALPDASPELEVRTFGGLDGRRLCFHERGVVGARSDRRSSSHVMRKIELERHLDELFHLASAHQRRVEPHRRQRGSNSVGEQVMARFENFERPHVRHPERVRDELREHFSLDTLVQRRGIPVEDCGCDGDRVLYLILEERLTVGHIFRPRCSVLDPTPGFGDIGLSDCNAHANKRTLTAIAIPATTVARATL